MSQLGDTVAYLKKHGPCRARDLEAAGYRRQDLQYLIQKGKVERLTRGVYQVAQAPMSTHPGYAEIFLRAPKAVLCLLSALNYHGLTTQLPHQVWIAIEGQSRIPKLAYPPLKVARFSGAAFSAGVERHKVDGITLRVYSVAKTVTDLFKMRNKVGLDVAMEALREALQSKKATRAEILKMAKVNRMQNVMRPYLEMEAALS
jgi:predicted transcriptional regulator of viral defense system